MISIGPISTSTSPACHVWTCVDASRLSSLSESPCSAPPCSRVWTLGPGTRGPATRGKRSALPVTGFAAVGQAPSNSEPIRSGRPPCAGDIDRCWPSTTPASGWPAPTSIPGWPNAYGPGVSVRASRYGHAAGPARLAGGVRRNPRRLTSSACGDRAFFAARRASWLRPLQLARALSAGRVHASTAQLSIRHTGMTERLRPGTDVDLNSAILTSW